MYISSPKKMNIVLILEVLKKYSDENHKLTQKEIENIIMRDYDVTVDRHTLKRNLDNLLDFNCGVEYTQRDKETKTAGGWYFEHDLTEAEARMLIDGLLFSKYIPYSECKGLIKKIENLSSIHFKSSYALPENRPENKEIFLNIEELLYAISKDKKVAFNYMRYGTDKKMHITKNDDGTPKIRIVSPYEIVITNGRYYLIGAPEQGDEIFHYRLDQICNVEILKSQKRKPVSDFPKYKNGFKLDEYMKERPYMTTGCDSLKVTIRLKKDAIGHVIDWLGKDAWFFDETEDSLKAIVTVNEKAMLYWALQYGKFVEVLEPQSLRDKIRDVLADMSQRYA